MRAMNRVLPSLLLVFVAGSAFAGCSEPRRARPRCSITADCPAGEICLDGACRASTSPDVGSPVSADVGSLDAAGSLEDAGVTLEAGLREVCGNRDDEDADGRVDEGCSACAPGEDDRPCYELGDPSLAGTGACVRGSQQCVGDSEFGSWGECEGDVGPEPEICGNGLDEDCDGAADEGCVCTAGESRECYGFDPATAGVGICRRGTQTCAAGGEGWGECTGVVGPGPELCDGVDNDCDGTVDEGCAPGCRVGVPSTPIRGNAIVIGEGTTWACEIVCLLHADGWHVDHLPNDEDLDGSRPLAGRYDVAVLIDGTEWSANMPEAGQRDIVDFVSGGGGLVSVEWVAWEIGAAGRFLTIAEVVPVSYGGSWRVTDSTYTRRTAHPIASTLPAVFSVGSHGWSSSALRAGATELYTLDAAGTPGLATWDVGAGGRSAWFAAANGYASFRWLSSPELTEALARSVSWAGHRPSLDIRYRHADVMRSCGI
ncbi:MAG: MopE-related protein [Deltaproteobacteria bacterium]